MSLTGKKAVLVTLRLVMLIGYKDRVFLGANDKNGVFFYKKKTILCPYSKKVLYLRHIKSIWSYFDTVHL